MNRQAPDQRYVSCVNALLTAYLVCAVHPERTSREILGARCSRRAVGRPSICIFTTELGHLACAGRLPAVKGRMHACSASTWTQLSVLDSEHHFECHPLDVSRCCDSCKWALSRSLRRCRNLATAHTSATRPSTPCSRKTQSG